MRMDNDGLVYSRVSSAGGFISSFAGTGSETRAEAEAEAEAEEREIKRFIFICKFDQESNLLMHHTQTGN